MKIKSKINWAKLIISILATEGLGILGISAITSSIKTWYATEVIKPKFYPSSWIFISVSILLFLLMAFSLYRVWQKKGDLFWFWTQLLLNLIWFFLFFGFHLLVIAFYEILILWIVILITIKKFKKIDLLASKLLWPYFVWVTYILVLNHTIMVLN